MPETQVRSLGQEDPRRREWQPTPVSSPGESPGQRSLAGCSPRGHRVRHDWTTDTIHKNKGQVGRKQHFPATGRCDLGITRLRPPHTSRRSEWPSSRSYPIPGSPFWGSKHVGSSLHFSEPSPMRTFPTDACICLTPPEPLRGSSNSPWRRKWQPTPVFLPGESQGQRSLMGCHLWGLTESDTTKAT